jgi:hypothetical protein
MSSDMPPAVLSCEEVRTVRDYIKRSWSTLRRSNATLLARG